MASENGFYIVSITGRWSSPVTHNMVFSTLAEAMHGAAEHVREWADEDIEGDDGTEATDDIVIEYGFGEDGDYHLDIKPAS